MALTAHLAIPQANSVNAQEEMESLPPVIPDDADTEGNEAQASAESRRDFFLIPGGTTTAGYEYWIEVKGFRFDVWRQTAGANAFGLSIIKEQEESSPLLSHGCAAGTSLPYVFLEIDHGSGRTMRYTLVKAKIVKVQAFFGIGSRAERELAGRLAAADTPDTSFLGVPLEEIIFSYTQIRWRYNSGTIPATGVEPDKRGAISRSWNGPSFE